MKLCDLHCDTITACMKKGESLVHASGHISLDQAGFLERWIQVFAIFVPDTLHGETAAEYFDSALVYYLAQRENISQYCQPILALENGSALGGNLGRLELLARCGVKVITITWNGANELGFGAHCNERLGLTDLGKRAVQRMFELGILPDVSHLNPAGFEDVAELAAQRGGVFFASHSNCASVQPHCRNLSDAQIKTIIASGGLIGLNLYPEFLGGAGTAEDVAAHLQHVIALGGENHVALGSDFDGCTVHENLAGLEKLSVLKQRLEELGVSAAQLENFFWKNGANFLKNTCIPPNDVV